MKQYVVLDIENNELHIYDRNDVDKDADAWLKEHGHATCDHFFTEDFKVINHVQGTIIKQDYKPILKCPLCRGTNLLIRAWVDANTNEFAQDDDDRCWCEDCWESVRPEEITYE